MTDILIIGSARDSAEFEASLAGDVRVHRLAPGHGAAGLAAAALEAAQVLVDLSLGSAPQRLELLGDLFARGCRPRAAYVGALTMTATQAATALPAAPVAAIGWLPGVTATAASIEIAPALQTGPEAIQALKAELEALTAREVEIVEDRLGLVSARVLAMVINEAAFAVMENVASPEDIDTAMRLGTNYPLGPLAWCDRIGAATVEVLLDALQAEYGEERYRPCVLLRQFARAGRTFHAPAVAAP